MPLMDAVIGVDITTIHPPFILTSHLEPLILIWHNDEFDIHSFMQRMAQLCVNLMGNIRRDSINITNKRWSMKNNLTKTTGNGNSITIDMIAYYCK